MARGVFNFLRRFAETLQSPLKRYDIYGHGEGWVLRGLEEAARLPVNDLECRKERWHFPRRIIQVQRSIGLHVSQTITRFDIFSKNFGKNIGTLIIASEIDVHREYLPFPLPRDPLMRGEFTYHGVIFCPPPPK